MDVQDAVGIAKEWVNDTFKDENIAHLGLEEIDFDDHSGHWRVTLGFSRPWEQSKTAIAMLSGSSIALRSFKIVTIDATSGKVLSLKNREIAA